MRLILVRHGETAELAKGVVQGYAPCKLNEKGIEQARRVSIRLKDEKPDAILSSDLCRAACTAQEIAKFHKIAIRYTPELREMKMGVFEGRPRDEFHQAVAESGVSRAEFRPEGGESYIDLKERVQAFLDKSLKKYKGKTVIIVTHGGVIKLILSILLKMPIEEALKIKPANASVSIIEVGEKESKAHVINCIMHL